MTLRQQCNVEKYRFRATAEALRSADTGCDVEEHRHGMVKDKKQGWYWGPRGWYWGLHGSKQLTRGQLKKCKPGAGENWFSG